MIVYHKNNDEDFVIDRVLIPQTYFTSKLIYFVDQKVDSLDPKSKGNAYKNISCFDSLEEAKEFLFKYIKTLKENINAG